MKSNEKKQNTLEIRNEKLYLDGIELKNVKSHQLFEEDSGNYTIIFEMVVAFE